MDRRLFPPLIASLVAASASLPLAAHAQTDPRPVIRVSSGAEDIVTLDPDRATSTNDVSVVAEIFNGLVRFAPGSADPKSLEADLAESWKSSQDNKVWTFNLRHGVKFHGDWGDLTSADVVYSLKRAADPKRSSFAADFAEIQNVESIDPYTVRVTLKYPDATFLGRVSNYHGGYIVSMKAAEKYGNQFGNHPIGMGPFVFSQHVTQQYVKLLANDQYFLGKPKLAGITYRMIPSDSNRELAFDSGELDVIYGKREKRWVERERKRSGTHVDIFQPAEFRTLYLNRTIKPLDNIEGTPSHCSIGGRGRDHALRRVGRRHQRVLVGATRLSERIARAAAIPTMSHARANCSPKPVSTRTHHDQSRSCRTSRRSNRSWKSSKLSWPRPASNSRCRSSIIRLIRRRAEKT